MKRQMDDNEEDHNGGSGDGPSIKKRRGEGPHVECRVLLASKVCRLFRSTAVDGKCRAIMQGMVKVNTWVFILRRYKWHIHAGSWSLVNCWWEGSTLPYKGCS